MMRILLPHGFFAIVDDEDFCALSKWKWHMNHNGYAVRDIRVENNRRAPCGMHRQIMGLAYKDGKQIDHINGNKLDNRKSNLRVCLNEENIRNRNTYSNNSSGFKGVHWHVKDKKWHARIRINGKGIHLGVFDDPKVAYDAYCKASLELHGEFANFGNGCVLLEG